MVVVSSTCCSPLTMIAFNRVLVHVLESLGRLWHLGMCVVSNRQAWTVPQTSWDCQRWPAAKTLLKQQCSQKWLCKKNCGSSNHWLTIRWKAYFLVCAAQEGSPPNGGTQIEAGRNKNKKPFLGLFLFFVKIPCLACLWLHNSKD